MRKDDIYDKEEADDFHDNLISFTLLVSLPTYSPVRYSGSSVTAGCDIYSHYVCPRLNGTNKKFLHNNIN